MQVGRQAAQDRTDRETDQRENACTTFLPTDEPNPQARSRQVDWAGIGLLAVGLACFQTMLEQGQEDDWFSSRFITGMAVCSVVGIGLFIHRELTIEHPAVDLRVLRHRSMIGGSLFSAILGMGIYGIMFAIPVFVQDHLHYTATQSGILQVPGAIAAAFAMLLFGKLGNRFDPRVLIAAGALLTTSTGVLLMGLNPETNVNSIFWPLILRSVGSVIMFMPLSIATLGPLPKKDIAAGAGFYSLTRQLGSSIGIALITTMLARRMAEHRAILVENVSLYRPAAMDRLNQLIAGFSAQNNGDVEAARHRALGVLDAIVNGQSALLSYADIFFYVALTFVVSLPLLLLFRRTGGRAAEEAAAAAH